jgi:hypothetical protein
MEIKKTCVKCGCAMKSQHEGLLDNDFLCSNPNCSSPAIKVNTALGNAMKVVTPVFFICLYLLGVPTDGGNT